MAYILKQQDIFDFANSRTYQYRQKGDELFFKYCPYCKGGESTPKDKETFSINLSNGTYKCFRASCGKQGHFVELARDFNFPLEFDNAKAKKYRTLPQKTLTPSDSAYSFMASRGISKETVDKYKITTQKNNKNIIVFPFYDENNILVSVKYRKADFDKTKDKCKEWFEKDTKPILFGMAQCEKGKNLIITEGQIDSLSVADCGYNNAVSVPNGAVAFTWLPDCWKWLEQFDEVIVFGDLENGKMSLIDKLEKTLKQKVKAVRTEDYLGEKDANDIYRKYGKGAIITCIENAEIRKLENVKDLSEVKKVDLANLPKIRTNISELDKTIGGLIYGQLIILSGKRGEGKSTFMSQLVCEILEQGESVFIYSGELSDFHFKCWLDLQLAGHDNLDGRENEDGVMYGVLKEGITEKINAWYSGRAYIYDNSIVFENEGEYESLIDTVEKVIRRYNVRVICIDNLMTAMETVTEQNNLYLAQSNFVGKLKKIATKYEVVVILVAHPRKGGANITNDDIAGSSDITNKADVVMSYQRPQRTNEDEDRDFDSVLNVTKNRLNGYTTNGNGIKLCYDPITKRVGTPASIHKNYGWYKEPEEVVYFDDLPFEVIE